MKQLLTIMRSRSVSSIVVILAISALCLSVGEGLRLRPFPVTEHSRVEQSTAARMAVTSQLSAYTYGPLDVPNHTQKRTKRPTIDLTCASSVYTSELLGRRLDSAAHEQITIASALFVALPSGRAPPFLS